MSLRLAASFAAVLCLAMPGFAGEARAKPAAAMRDKEPALSPARERQKRCGIEWRGLSTTDKTAKGPTWPQFYSKCVKRLKATKA
ncbi:hypothetical protein [Methylobacterium haplocladii]|uniref:Uncharacterized protein n=1 Tax=Methylobacterium haplocladii TaxID=1176176 RepID=A0A512IRH3_9HYPH|nr:hypothetical protein [Methylobacterium haplocladii]GEP00308.1 hypothetical protein MHA02_26950 [Methylobacterium haplocladii]GJD86079.1 hypothetical protein HPGCJGGD_3976 [Methylobacterium haplocladii]GLS59798.1 hypothetical protein GCM10007887_24710 [Methylobacterium haplocladii]